MAHYFTREEREWITNYRFETWGPQELPQIKPKGLIQKLIKLAHDRVLEDQVAAREAKEAKV